MWLGYYNCFILRILFGRLLTEIADPTSLEIPWHIFLQLSVHLIRGCHTGPFSGRRVMTPQQIHIRLYQFLGAVRPPVSLNPNNLGFQRLILAVARQCAGLSYTSFVASHQIYEFVVFRGHPLWLVPRNLHVWRESLALSCK